MPQMIRESGVGAERRVARILRQGGPPAVITEIGLIHSDGSKRIYLEQLFSQATLNTEQLKEAARLIRGISSDGDKAQVLTTVDEKYFNGDLRGIFSTQSQASVPMAINAACSPRHSQQGWRKHRNTAQRGKNGRTHLL